MPKKNSTPDQNGQNVHLFYTLHYVVGLFLASGRGAVGGDKHTHTQTDRLTNIATLNQRAKRLFEGKIYIKRGICRSFLLLVIISNWLGTKICKF